MDQTAMSMLILVMFIALGVVGIWGLVQWIKAKEYKAKFIEYRLQQNEFIALYVLTARENRRLSQKFNKYKHAVVDSFLAGFGFDDVLEWHKKYDLKDAGLEVNPKYGEDVIKANVTVEKTNTSKKYEHFFDTDPIPETRTTNDLEL